MDEEHFNRFLEALDDYLYRNGWFTNGYYIKQKCHTYDDVISYLTEHCYSEMESAELVAKIRRQSR